MVAAILIGIGCGRQSPPPAGSGTYAASFRDAHHLYEPAGRPGGLTVDRPDEPVAWVNGRPVPRRDLAAAMVRRMAQVPGGLSPERLREAEAAVGRAAFQDVVVQNLLHQEASALPSPPPEEVEAVLAGLARQVPEGRTLDQVLAAQGLTAGQVRTQIEGQLRMQRLLRERAGEIPAPSADEVELFFVENQERFQIPERVVFRHLLVRAGAEAGRSADEARERARALRERAAAGEDLGGLIREASDDPAAREGEGRIGPVPTAQLPAPLAAALRDLAPGELGPVVEIGDAHLVVRLEAREAARLPEFSEAEAMARELILRRRQQEAVERYIQQLVRQADVRMAEAEAVTEAPPPEPPTDTQER